MMEQPQHPTHPTDGTVLKDEQCPLCMPPPHHGKLERQGGLALIKGLDMQCCHGKGQAF